MHKAKRTLSFRCENCSDTIDKGEKYTKHMHQITGYWVMHVICPLKKMTSTQKLHSIKVLFMKGRLSKTARKQINKILETEY